MPEDHPPRNHSIDAPVPIAPPVAAFGEPPVASQQPQGAPPSRAVAPVWHTIVLMIGILAVSASGPSRISAGHLQIHRLATYSTTAAMELVMLAWVLFGLWLRKIPLRRLFGVNSLRLRAIALDVGIAIVFWIGSLMVLGTLAIAWVGIESLITHRPLIGANGQPAPQTAGQQKTMQTLVQLAPSNGEEIAAWVMLCVVAGFVEEAVFRGYLQQQFSAWGRGSVAAGVVFSALMFGAAHAYEGARAMFLIAVFGVLFSLLAHFRRSLRPGMMAHCMQDLFAGIALALLKSHHII